MSDILAIFFLIATLITAIFWIINKKQNYRFKNKKNILFNKNIKYYNFLKKTKYISYIASFFPIFIVIFIIRSFLYEPFQIPSGSMMPTLLTGDFILVEKFSYGIRDPILHYKFFDTGKPKRGDIVVFRKPNNIKIFYIKRVIGLPGDQIIYDAINKTFTIHQECYKEKNCQKNISTIHEKYTLNKNIKNKIKLTNNEENTTLYYINPNNKKLIPLIFNVFQEKIDKKIFKILLSDQITDQINEYYQQTGQKKGVWIVPKDQYFMIGDNRDDSYDSRYWGFVPEKNLVGKAITIWMSFNKEENKWPVGIRLNRIGNIY